MKLMNLKLNEFETRFQSTQCGPSLDKFLTVGVYWLTLPLLEHVPNVAISVAHRGDNVLCRQPNAATHRTEVSSNFVLAIAMFWQVRNRVIASVFFFFSQGDVSA